MILSVSLGACSALTATRRSDAPAALEGPHEAITLGTVPGMAVLEVRNGRVVGEAAQGVREAGTRRQVRAGDVWHLGSNGKPITATLIARLVERGGLAWAPGWKICGRSSRR